MFLPVVELGVAPEKMGLLVVAFLQTLLDP